MATYIYTLDVSDLAPSWPQTTLFDYDMFTGASGAGSTNDSIPGSVLRSASFITLAGVPNNNDFENGGTITIRLDVSMGDPDFRGRCRCVRLDSSGNILGVKGAFTGLQVIDQDRTFTPVSPTWTGVESCSDRFAIEWEFENLDSMAHALKLNVRVTTADIVTDISEDVGACVGGVPEFIPLAQNAPLTI